MPPSQADLVRAMYRRGLRGSQCIEPSFGYRDRDGYVRIRVGKTKQYVHRFVYKLEHGEVPQGTQVLHHCDNPPCCNLNHLFLGTHTDNMNDRQRKGRQPPQPTGQEAHGAILTWRQVHQIRNKHKAGASQSALAKEYGVGLNTVHCIVRHKTWKKGRAT